jgi:hypothetical protein
MLPTTATTATNTPATPFLDHAAVPPPDASLCSWRDTSIIGTPGTIEIPSYLTLLVPAATSPLPYHHPPHPYSSSSRCNVPDESLPIFRDRLDVKGWERRSDEGEGVSEGEVDFFDVDVALECDGPLIGELGGEVEAGLVGLFCRGLRSRPERGCRTLQSANERRKHVNIQYK